MTNKELFYFTAKCLMLNEDPSFRETIIESIETDSIDWKIFASLCSNHLVLPVIYLRFNSHQLLEHLPVEFVEFLKEIYELNLNRNLQILEQLKAITNVLNQSNIYPTYLKGAAHLLDGLYSDVGERILGDIDFLVPEKNYLAAGKIMEKGGYKNIITKKIYYALESLKHYPRLAHPQFPAVIEIHRELTESYLNWFNPKIVDSGKKEVDSLGGCYVLCDQHKIILNFVHR